MPLSQLLILIDTSGTDNDVNLKSVILVITYCLFNIHSVI